MLSHIRSLRHIIMATVTIASFMGVTLHSALAVSTEISATFTILVEGGGKVEGSFKGKDLDSNGFIEVFDVEPDGDNNVDPTTHEFEATLLSATWTPGPGQTPDAFPQPLTVPDAISPFGIPSFIDPSQVEFHYDVTKGKITNLFLNNGLTLNCFNCDEHGKFIFITGTRPDASAVKRIIDTQTVTLQGPLPSAVPEPSTVILFSLGLVGVIASAVSRRARLTAPQRRPITDARH